MTGRWPEANKTYDRLMLPVRQTGKLNLVLPMELFPWKLLAQEKK